MYGKAGIPSNIPPHTDFTFQILRIEAKKQEENRKAQIQAETGLHISHNQEPIEKMMTPKPSDQAFLNIIIEVQQPTQLQSDSFLDKGHHTKQKT